MSSWKIEAQYPFCQEADSGGVQMMGGHRPVVTFPMVLMGEPHG